MHVILCLFSDMSRSVGAFTNASLLLLLCVWILLSVGAARTTAATGFTMANAQTGPRGGGQETGLRAAGVQQPYHPLAQRHRHGQSSLLAHLPVSLSCQSSPPWLTSLFHCPVRALSLPTSLFHCSVQSCLLAYLPVSLSNQSSLLAHLPVSLSIQSSLLAHLPVSLSIQSSLLAHLPVSLSSQSSGAV